MIEAALKDFLLDKPPIRQYTGRHIYDGRIPQDSDASVIVVLRKISAEQFEDLPGQPQCMASVIQVECFSRGPGAGVRAWKVSEGIRKATAKDCYRGPMGCGEHGRYVFGCTIIRESMRVPTPPAKDSDSWTHRYSQDLRITHDQD